MNPPRYCWKNELWEVGHLCFRQEFCHRRMLQMGRNYGVIISAERNYRKNRVEVQPTNDLVPIL